MHLSSSLEPNGQKSSGHYLVLRHESRRELIQLPEAYSDLQKHVETHYHLKSGEFEVETEELNMCAEERIRIPEGLWSDVAKLLGNVYVVPRASDPHPESGPEPVIEPTSSLPTTHGLINLETPLVKDELIVVNLGTLNSEAGVSPSSKFFVQILDKESESALTVVNFPHLGLISLNTAHNTMVNIPLKEAFPLVGNHNIVIRQVQSVFEVRFDSRVIGSVQAPAHGPLTSVSFDLGNPPPFKGPVSAQVYSGSPILSSTSLIHTETLYQQILECNPQDSEFINAALLRVREGATNSSEPLNPIIKWRGEPFVATESAKLDWNFAPRSLCLIRFTLQKAAPRIYAYFGVYQNYGLRMEMAPSTADFSENNVEAGKLVEYHKFRVNSSFYEPGEHSIAFVNRDGKVQVMFDFKQSTVLPDNTLLDRKPKEIATYNLRDCGVVAEVYDFSA